MARIFTRYIVFLLVFGGNCAAWSEGIGNLNLYLTPNVPRPHYLESIQDPTFGNSMIRVTDAGQRIINPGGDPTLKDLKWGYETGHGYSSRAAWNADESLLVIEKGVDGDVFLDGENYEPMFQRTIPGSARWDPINPNVMLFVDKKKQCVGAYRVISSNVLWRRCLIGYESIEWSDPGKGKPSMDGMVVPVRALRSSDRHWVALLFDVAKKTFSDEIDMTAFVEEGDDPDFVLSPLADVIIVVGCLRGHSGRCNGQVAIDVATRKVLWRVFDYHAPGHADEFVDQLGEQWRVGVAKEGKFKGQIIKRNFRTGQVISLIPFWGSHTSTRNIHDPSRMVIVSYQDVKGPLRNEIVGVCPDGSCLQRYAHTHRVDDGRYLAETQASVSPRGDKIIFRSNWGNKNGPIDSYVIDLREPMIRNMH